MSRSSERNADRPTLAEVSEITGLPEEEILARARGRSTKYEWIDDGVPSKDLVAIFRERKSQSGTAGGTAPKSSEGQVLITRCLALLRRLEKKGNYRKVLLVIRDLEDYLGIEEKHQFKPADDNLRILPTKN